MATLRETAGPLYKEVRRLVRWRIASARQPSIFKLGGISVSLDSQVVTREIRNAIYSGWYEAEEAQIVRSAVQRGTRVLEIGSGLGYVTALLCQLSGDQNVTTVEANPALVEVTRATCSLNGFHPRVEWTVLGKGDMQRTFYVDRNFWASGLARSDDVIREVTVGQVDFAELIRSVGAELLVIDIEGGEIELLAEELPDCVRQICIECHPRTVGDSATTEMLNRLWQQGFVLRLEHVIGTSAYLSRPSRDG